VENRLEKRVLQDAVVKRLVEAERALQLAVAVPQAKLVHDVVHAQKVFAKRRNLSDEVIGHAHRVETEALARLGALLRDMPKATGTRGQLRGRDASGGSHMEPPEHSTPTLSEVLNLPTPKAKKLASIAEELAGLPKETREKIANREQTLSAARRDRKAAETRRRVDLPDAKYRVIYADPPWSYGDKADAGAVQSQGAAHHYPTMSIAELCALDIRTICEPNAVLFLWTTSPLLFECAPVILAWGFDYRASIVWNKAAHNMGHYVSVQHEFLLIGVRGSCMPDTSKLLPSVVTMKRGAHSVKPGHFRQMIDTMYPHGKRIELFARSRVQGWDAYGYEAV
jgi:N6-adenosine-specific RNA methylase IME4